MSSQHPKNRVIEVIKQLADANLLVTDEQGEKLTATVDVAHEALIRSWPKLREWLDENRDLLRQQRKIELASEEWNIEGRKPGYLLQGLPLIEARQFRTRHSIKLPLSDLTNTFIQISIRQQLFNRLKTASWLIIPTVLTIGLVEYSIRDNRVRENIANLSSDNKDQQKQAVQNLVAGCQAKEELFWFPYIGEIFYGLCRSLRYRSLISADLRGVDLRNADLRNTDLRDTDLSGANLSGADLRDADLASSTSSDNGPNFSYANLSNAQVGGTYFIGADFSNAILRNTLIRGSTLRFSSFRSANLEDASLSGSDFVGSDFSYASLRNTSFNESLLIEGNFSNTELQGTDLRGADLYRTNFNKARLKGTKLLGGTEFGVHPADFAVYRDVSRFSGAIFCNTILPDEASLPGSVRPLDSDRDCKELGIDPETGEPIAPENAAD